MKLLLFSDLHAHTYKDFARPPKNPANISSRFEACLTVLNKVRKYAVRNKVSHVIHAGDLFHVRNVYKTAMYNPVYEGVEKFKRDGIHLVLLVGNHDQTSTDGSVHSLLPMRHIATVVDKPVTLKVGSLSVRCVPYMDSAADFVAATQVEADLLVGHAGIYGAVTGPVEYRPPEEIDVNDLGAFAFTFLGHYHKCQKLKERVWYIGSPLQQNRGERDDTDKGFLLYDSERNKFKRIPLHMPEFKTYKGNTEGLTGHYVDVFTSSDDVTKTLADVEAIKPAAVNLVPVPVVESKWKVRVRINPAMSLQDMAKKYIKEYLPDRMESRREDVLRMALSFLEG